MVSILRQPDYSFGATEKSDFRFEESKSLANDVIFDYKVNDGVGKVTVYPSGSPVKYLRLRFEGDMSDAESVYSDQWERCSEGAYFEWTSIMPHKALPWFCYVKTSKGYVCYGVKTCPNCFAYWQVDVRGVSLFMNLMNASDGTDLKEPIIACELVEMLSYEGEDAFSVARRFAKVMCDNPVPVKQPIFGVNNWYWAYGKISKESVMTETDYLLQMCDGTKNKPYMILDDGWQQNRTYGVGAYIGGPWLPNERFKDMSAVAQDIKNKGAKPGIWFRPLLTLGDVPEEAKKERFDQGGVILDPTHPYTLERVYSDARNLYNWGYDLIKHDFTTFDIFGGIPFSRADKIGSKHFFDKTITTAMAVKNVYMAVAKGANDAEVIGCNTISHLTAGIHSIYRVGNDTSGRSFEWTRRNGVNSMMRLPLNDLFYKVDPDCAAFTERVDSKLNLDFLQMCAITGVTTLASVTPGILSKEEMKRINEIYRIADEDKSRYVIKNYDKHVNPSLFVSSDGKDECSFDWESAYRGARNIINWFN